jgi:parallel beta-helix repeat protein
MRVTFKSIRNILASMALTLGFISLAAVPAAGAMPGENARDHGDDVECGARITADTELHKNLVNCPGNGIVIGADGIELDLNGHTIDGDGELGCTEFYACDFGIDNTAGHHGVTIEDGSIRDFATAVFVFGGSHNRLHRLSASHNILGGMLLIASQGTRIERNSISANGLATDQAGLIAFDSGEIRIERNSVFDNGDIGMFLVGLGDSRVEQNRVSGNPEAGMLFDGDGNDVSRNRVSHNGDGIGFTGDGNTIAGNHVSNAAGCPDGCGFGISFEGGTGNLVAHNLVARTREAGIRVASFEPDTPPAVDNVIRRNLVLHAGIDGVLVESTATDTLLERNIAIRAGDDGIDVDSGATTVTRNLSLRNGDLGIEAVAGVTDGGGNKAHGNGNPAQCLNVACP